MTLTLAKSLLHFRNAKVKLALTFSILMPLEVIVYAIKEVDLLSGNACMHALTWHNTSLITVVVLFPPCCHRGGAERSARVD